MRQYRLQKRQHPIFSPLAILSTLFLACGLAVGLYMSGGHAFSPGDLSAVNRSGMMIGGFFTHADFGDNCNECHTPFKGVEAGRCEKCHENVARQRQTGLELHGRFEMAEVCARCHLEHKGNEYDLTAAALADFDHEVTNFSLVKHVVDFEDAPLDCTACHLDEDEFTVFVSACIDCHGAKQSSAGENLANFSQETEPEFMVAHIEAYGRDCFACHDGLDTMADFTIEAHAETFALTGVHADTGCEGCHSGGRFEGTSTACVACHAEPEAHTGLFDTDCAACHTAAGWLPATLDDLPFDHARATGFSLVRHTTDYNGLDFTCRACHTGNRPLDFTDSQCVDCHRPADPAFLDGHIALFGENCLSCHDGSGTMTDFDHNLVWSLDGRHAVIDCTSCHVGQVFRGTPRECVACHAEPAIHSGLFGTDCAACHTAQAWQPARLVRHTFPLDHGEQGELACTVCHTTTYTEYTCYGCHEHDPAETEHKHLEEGISQLELPNCAQCHPTGREDESKEKDDD